MYNIDQYISYYKKRIDDIDDEDVDEEDIKEVKDVLRTILIATEDSFNSILINHPSEIMLLKSFTEKDYNFWINTVSQVIISYSYYFYSNHPDLENSSMKEIIELSYKLWWENIFKFFNKVFKEKINIEIVDYYATGLKGDSKKEYLSEESFTQGMIKDAIVVAEALLENIWSIKINEEIKKELYLYNFTESITTLSLDSRRVFFISVKIWQSYKNNVQPFLMEIIEKK